MEDMEDDPMKLWKSTKAWDTFPDDNYIPCPLQGDILHAPYSLPNVMEEEPSLYMRQVEAYTIWMGNPPLTKTSMYSKAPKMSPLDPDTIHSRLTTIDYLAGFAKQHLGLEPTMELILFPQVVAKFNGFHLARGNSTTYIKKHATNMAMAIDFVISTHCPKLIPYGEVYIRHVVEWHHNLNSKMFASITPHPSTKAPQDVTLFDVWNHINASWDKFKGDFEVSGGVKVCVHLINSLP